MRSVENTWEGIGPKSDFIYFIVINKNGKTSRYFPNQFALIKGVH